mmetsp:Transcript_84013/g.232839  ORF Transcript_84013/g.232839 Transcript_84013/m.232839 type:complete len:235 (+) Transcript_84013:371-1075(+)
MLYSITTQERRRKKLSTSRIGRWNILLESCSASLFRRSWRMPDGYKSKNFMSCLTMLAMISLRTESLKSAVTLWVNAQLVRCAKTQKMNVMYVWIVVAQSSCSVTVPAPTLSRSVFMEWKTTVPFDASKIMRQTANTYIGRTGRRAGHSMAIPFRCSLAKSLLHDSAARKSSLSKILLPNALLIFLLKSSSRSASFEPSRNSGIRLSVSLSRSLCASTRSSPFASARARLVNLT